MKMKISIFILHHFQYLPVSGGLVSKMIIAISNSLDESVRFGCISTSIFQKRNPNYITLQNSIEMYGSNYLI